eukprot:CAMPEP_0171073012 /NCGR_PEP_ID=MMETSP0766_2-20121228/11234_1 /TAXON_ID=439317 /ORGANISM="Gambierdiscus australes, Strain CAWD 149" /LENGTH=57 /DNA_ID=CAMNT_0011529659 /DNA_START=176 /DNA_END=346 /DNA_ORIENTATION=-
MARSGPFTQRELLFSCPFNCSNCLKRCFSGVTRRRDRHATEAAVQANAMAAAAGKAS